MLRVNRKVFFECYKARIDAKISGAAVAALDALLDFIERDPYVNHVPDAAYMLATVKWETSHTFLPIREYGGDRRAERMYGYLSSLGKRLGNDAPGEGAAYAGTGLVQLTGENNFEWAENMLPRKYPDLVARWELRTGKPFDLTVGDQPNDARDPFNAMDPEISYAILSEGMRVGQFGRSMLSYTHQNPPNYFDARRSVNRGDHKSYKPIADIAENFERCLRAALAAATSIGISAGPEPTSDVAPAVQRLSDQLNAQASGIAAIVPVSIAPAATPAPAGDLVAAPPVPAHAIAGGGPNDPQIKVTEKEPVTETMYGLARSLPAKVYGLLFTGGTISVAGLSEWLGFAKTYDGLILTGLVIFGIIFAGLYLMHMRHTSKKALDAQEFELNKLRLLIAANPGLINVK